MPFLKKFLKKQLFFAGLNYFLKTYLIIIKLLFSYQFRIMKNLSVMKIKSSMAPLYIYMFMIYSSKAIERSVTKEINKFVVLACLLGGRLLALRAAMAPEILQIQYICICIWDNEKIYLHSTCRCVFRETKFKRLLLLILFFIPGVYFLFYRKSMDTIFV